MGYFLAYKILKGLGDFILLSVMEAKDKEKLGKCFWDCWGRDLLGGVNLGWIPSQKGDAHPD